MIMATNVGMKPMRLEGGLRGFGVAKYDAGQLANILGFSHMADKHRIKNDNAVEDVLIVTTDLGSVKFERDQHLYTYQPSEKYLKSIAATKDNAENIMHQTTDTNDISNNQEVYFYVDFVMTIEGNCDGYTDKQYKRAKRTWKLHVNTGGGGFDNFKYYLQ